VDAPAAEVKDLNQALGQAVSQYPSRTFLRFDDRDIAFKEFDAEVGRLAGELRYCVGPGDKVLVMMRNSLEMVHTWVARNRLGATWVPFNVELKLVTLKHVIESAEARILIIDDEFLGEVRSTNTFGSEDIFKNGGSWSPLLSSLYTNRVPIA
jgi:acyl-CoA synthetase (AMP-forming)/AMP-acid ligase II